MAGITDAAMRDLCRALGAENAYTEMVSAKGMLYDNARTKELIMPGRGEDCVIVQLFGSDPEILAEATRKTQEMLEGKLAGIDINMACPAPKIVNNGEGSALMKDMALSSKIIHAVKKAARVPLSIKIRAGFSADDKNAPAFAAMAEEWGADSISVHGRTREQYYAGIVDREIIALVKKSVRIPVFASGDIFSAEDAKSMIEDTNTDGVLIARGAVGNPFIFAQTNELFTYGEVRTAPTQKERLEMCLLQLSRAISYKGEKLAVMQFRTHAAHYIKGMKNAAKLRNEVVRTDTYAGLEKLLAPYM